MNDTSSNTTLWIRTVPLLAAAIAIVGFARLGLWQLDRAAEKEALVADFADDRPRRELDVDDETMLFERVKLRGRWLGERQVLIDNITNNGRVGYYVVTPVELPDDHRRLLVNRGWVDKQRGIPDDSRWQGVSDWIELRGRIGRLPRAGLQTGAAFAGGSDWPRVAVFPTQDEVARALGTELLPFVLLLDAAEERGFGRNWQPAKSGAMTHYGYAFQWFAMAFTVVAVTAWQLNKKRKKQ